MAKILVFICITLSMIGNPSILAIEIGSFYVNPFRISILLMLLFAFKDIKKSEYKIKINHKKTNFYSLFFMLIWILYAIFSLLWVGDYNGWLFHVTHLVDALIICVSFSKYIVDKDDLLKTFKLISIMMIIHNLLGWFEVLFGNYIFLSSNYLEWYTLEHFPTTTFSNTNDFATFMFFSVWVSYICLINAKPLIIKGLYFLLLISSTLLILATNSRANILGLIVSIIVFTYLSFKHKKSRYILLILLSILFLIILVNPEIMYFANNILTFNFSPQANSENARINLVKNGLVFLKATFGFGVGAGNVEYWIEHRAQYNTYRILNMHNWWVEILTCYGILIFIMYLIFYVKLIKNFYKKHTYSKNKLDRSISLGICCFMIGLIISIISSSIIINKTWLWVFWGIAVAYQGIKADY